MNIISREAWGARPPTHITPIGSVAVVFAHTQAAAIDQTMTPAEEAAVMRGMQLFHMSSPAPKRWWRLVPPGRGFSDIAYSFVIFPSGRVFEGRGWRRSHGGNFGLTNQRSVSFCFAGHGDIQKPTPEAFESFRQLRSLGVRLGHIERVNRVLGHRDEVLPDGTHPRKTCPGNLIYPRLNELRLPPQGEVEEEDDPMASLTDAQVQQLLDDTHVVAEFIRNFKDAGGRAPVVAAQLDRIPVVEGRVNQVATAVARFPALEAKLNELRELLETNGGEVGGVMRIVGGEIVFEPEAASAMPLQGEGR